MARPRELARRAAAALSFDLAFVATFALTDSGLLAVVPPWATAWVIVGGLPWLLLTLKVLVRFGLGHGGRPLLVQLDVPGARVIAAVLVLLTWPLALLIPTVVYALAAHATAVTFVGSRGLIALRPILHLPIGVVGMGYLALVGILFAARSSAAKRTDAVPDFDPERLLQVSLPIGCGVLGVAIGHVGGCFDRIGLVTGILVLAVYAPFRYLIERVGGLTWLSVTTCVLAIASAIAIPLAS